MTVAEGVARDVRAGGRWRVRAPAVVLIPAVMVALAMTLPLAYLLVRSLGAGAEAWDLLLRMRTVEVVVRTVGLIVMVTGASVAIAVPLAWLTVRTDLPLRRVWSVATILPLAIPSYVGGLLVVVALGPRGMLQQLLEGLFGVERLPEIYGFPGAALTLTLLSYPFVLLTVRGALLRMDPALVAFDCDIQNQIAHHRQGERFFLDPTSRFSSNAVKWIGLVPHRAAPCE